MRENSPMTISSIWKYPITGGPGVPMDTAEMTPGGIVGDRDFIVARQTEDGLVRVGSKQAPELLSITYSENPFIVRLGETAIQLPRYEEIDISQNETACNEFGDPTPVLPTNIECDEAFSDFLGEKVVLVRKVDYWQQGLGDIRPRQRANAALHLISTASVEAIAEMSGAEPDVRRYKPNIVIDGVNAHGELRLVGHFAWIGAGSNEDEPDPLIRIDRGAPRCQVPSLDPETGESRGDIKLLSMPKVENIEGKMVRSAGVYGHLANGDTVTLKVGQEVRAHVRNRVSNSPTYKMQ